MEAVYTALHCGGSSVRCPTHTIELMDALEVHILRGPDRVVDHIKCRVDNELVEVGGVLALPR